MAFGIKKKLSKKVTFEITAPTAQSVIVAGSFNDWKTDITPLRKKKDGTWTTAVELPLGRHEYRFVVDGTWHSDESQPTVSNPFGEKNNVVEVE